MSVHNQFDYTSWLEKGTYYKGELVSRTLKTLYGEVRYWRTYLIGKMEVAFIRSMPVSD